MARHIWKTREVGRTECEDYDHITCHTWAILPAANTDVLCVQCDGCVEDDCRDADGRVGLHAV
jgi:hypothetical protein